MDCLFGMEQKGWIDQHNPLHGLADQLQEEVNDELILEMDTSKSASLHSGTTLVKCFRGNEGARQNHYVFVPFSFGPDAAPELCIMKVTGIARLRRWQPNLAGEQHGQAGHAPADEAVPAGHTDAIPVVGAGGGGGNEVAGEVKEWRLLFGQMASCEVLESAYRCNKYSDGPRLNGNIDAVHSLPSVVRPLPEVAEDGSGQAGSGQEGGGNEEVGIEAGLGNQWYDYAVLMQDVQATALIGSLEGNRVYLPYRPMSKHA